MCSALNDQSKRVLTLILNSRDYVSISSLSICVGVTKRSIYYDIEKINRWLNRCGFPQLISDKKLGVKVDQDYSVQIKRRLGAQLPYLLSPTERLSVIVCAVVLATDPVRLEDLANICQVSKNSILNDISRLKTSLASYGLKLHADLKLGYQILGSQRAVWALFFSQITSVLPLFPDDGAELVKPRSVDEYAERLSCLEADLGAEYVAQVIPSLALFLARHWQTCLDWELADSDLAQVVSSKEYRLVRQYFPELACGMDVYLAIHLLGSRLQSPAVRLDSLTERAHDLAELLADSFESVACVQISNRAGLVNALEAHLKTSLYRYHYGIQIGNPLLDSIRTEYSNLFAITKAACHGLEAELACPIQDDEIAYLTLHFGAFVGSQAPDVSPKRIAIACTYGVAVSNLLRAELEAILPAGTDIQTYSLKELESCPGYDLLVTTAKEITGDDVVNVSPLMTGVEKAEVLSRFLGLGDQPAYGGKTLRQIAAQYLSHEQLAAFTREVNETRQSLNPPERAVIGGKTGIADLLIAQHCLIGRDPVNYIDAIRWSAAPLVADGAILGEFVEQILAEPLDRLQRMVIAEQVMLVHANRFDLVNHLDLSVAVFGEPVDVSGVPVSVIFTLATPDNTSHLSVINDLVSLCAQPDFGQKLIESNNPTGLCQLIKSLIK